MTKDRYDVGDRIIARRPGYAMNYFGTVTNVLVRGGYTIRYDNGNILPTNHDQILGLTYQSRNNWPNAVQDQNVPMYLPQRVSPESIETIKRYAGNPVTKTEYLVNDRVIVRYEDTIADGNYTGTVMEGLMNGFYIIEYADGSACPCEHIQILGLTDKESSVDPIPNSELRIWLQQREIIPPPPPDPGGGGKEQLNQWFQDINNKVFRSEKEVEIHFVTPFLGFLGYHDINADMSFRVKNYKGKKTVIRLDFALFKDNDSEKKRPILIVEAKREGLFAKREGGQFKDPTKVADAQDQLRNYAYWTRCHFGLLTDSKTIQITDFSNFNHEVYQTYLREDIENSFAEIYDKISKKSLTSYYEKLPQNAGGF
jgi:hypothetical protein